jgi:anti-anti-sigma factor
VAESAEPAQSPAPLVDVRVEQVMGRTRAVLLGELDMSNADHVQRRLIAAADGGGSFELDLSRLGFLDSAGIAALHRLHQALSADGQPGRLRVTAGQDTVAGRTLRLAGMDQVLRIEAADGAA